MIGRGDTGGTGKGRVMDDIGRIGKGRGSSKGKLNGRKRKKRK